MHRGARLLVEPAGVRRRGLQEPVTGIVPPLSETAWQAEFAKYQATPEYQQPE